MSKLRSALVDIGRHYNEGVGDKDFLWRKIDEAEQALRELVRVEVRKALADESLRIAGIKSGL